jgi:hypothetical protein
MAKTAQSAAKIARQGTNVCALAAFSFQHGMIRVRNINELQSADLDRSRCKFHLLSVTGEIVSSLSFDLDRRVTRRNLLNEAGVGRQKRMHCLRRGPFLAYGNGATLSVVGIALFAPTYGETIELAPVHHERNSLGGFAERDRQRTGSERVERTGMTTALCEEQPLHDADCVC